MARTEYLLIEHTPALFEQTFGVRYLSNLEFCTPTIQTKVIEKSQKALAKKRITTKQKWLGTYYGPAIDSSSFLDLSIRWMNEKIGYGVWTNRPIKAHTFIGEYTGIVHRRRLWNRWKNLYCFDYTIGPHRSTRLVIDSQEAGNHLRFINHSFSPNLDLVSVYYKGYMRVILYANQNIPAETQLSYDYGEEYWEKRATPQQLI